MRADELIARALELVEAALLMKSREPAEWLAAARPWMLAFAREYVEGDARDLVAVASVLGWSARRARAMGPLLQLIARALDALDPPRAARRRAEAALYGRRSPRCSLCRARRGTNAGCDRCLAFQRMRAECGSAKTLQAELAEDRRRREAAEAQRLERGRGRTLRVGLVGCGKSKLSTAAPARDLYTGPLFRAARAYAEQTCDEWLVLSALYGVLTPDEVIEPYDLTLAQLRESEYATWALQVVSALRAHYDGLAVQFVGLAGQAYLEPVDGVFPLESPLVGLGLGARIKFLRDGAALHGAHRNGPATAS